eukprot:m.95213 g.95213  ORF g.95213 m.95213 type:complete len:94 (+) comp26796_c0_seq1:492-773(+)
MFTRLCFSIPSTFRVSNSCKSASSVESCSDANGYDFVLPRVVMLGDDEADRRDTARSDTLFIRAGEDVTDDIVGEPSKLVGAKRCLGTTYSTT